MALLRKWPVKIRHLTRLRHTVHTNEWVMSHLWMSDCTPQKITIHMNESFMPIHMNETCHTCEWVIALRKRSQYTWMSHSCQYTWMSHSCQYTWMSHVTLVNEWLHAHIWQGQRSQYTRTNESCRIWACLTTCTIREDSAVRRICVNVSHIAMSEANVSYEYEWVRQICVTHMNECGEYVSHISMRVANVSHIWMVANMSYKYEWVWPICVTHINKCGKCELRIWMNSANMSHTYEWVWRICVTYINEWGKWELQIWMSAANMCHDESGEY